MPFYNLNRKKNPSILDHGVVVSNDPNSIDFEGAGVTVTTSGNDVTVTIPGGSGSSGITRVISSVATNTAAGATASTDYAYLVSGTSTITLPTAVGNTNLYTVKRVGTNTVTVATTGGQTIDGSGSAAINVRYVSLDLLSDNSNWNIV